MNRYSPHYDSDEQRTTMSIDTQGSWVHIKVVEELLNTLSRAGISHGGTIEGLEQGLSVVANLRAELAAERAAHLATRQELSMALAERAHARAEAEMHKGLRAETLKANENLRAEVERLRLALEEATQCGCETCHAQARAALTGKEKP